MERIFSVPAESRHSAVLVDMHTLAGGRVVEVDTLEAGTPVVCAIISKLPSQLQSTDG